MVRSVTLPDEAVITSCQIYPTGWFSEPESQGYRLEDRFSVEVRRAGSGYLICRGVVYWHIAREEWLNISYYGAKTPDAASHFSLLSDAITAAQVIADSRTNSRGETFADVIQRHRGANAALISGDSKS